MKIILFGSSGQLGSGLLRKLLKNDLYQVFNFDSRSCNLNDKDIIQSKIISIKPDLIINCAAYTNVDAAESDYEKAYAINRDAIGIVAKSSKNIGCIVIHISTDYVFDGNYENEYLEDHKKSPLSVYGKSKSEGEDILIKQLTKYVILRTSWLVSESRKSFVGKIFESLSIKKNVSVVNDQLGKMTSVEWLSDVIVLIIEKLLKKNFNFGIYNVACAGSVSWYKIAENIAEFMSLKSDETYTVKKISIKDLDLPAVRPNKTMLSTKKIEKTLNVTSPHWKKELQKILERISA